MASHLRNQRVFVAGHKGMVGSAIVRRLKALGYDNILIASRGELDLMNQTKVQAWFTENKPEQVYIAAAKVGGIHANNTQPMLSHINVGTGVDCTIRELSESVARVTGYSGGLTFDSSKPDGTPRKLMDVSRLKALGWRAETSLEEGLTETYQWFLDNVEDLRQQ